MNIIRRAMLVVCLILMGYESHASSASESGVSESGAGHERQALNLIPYPQHVVINSPPLFLQNPVTLRFEAPEEVRDLAEHLKGSPSFPIHISTSLTEKSSQNSLLAMRIALDTQLFKDVGKEGYVLRFNGEDNVIVLIAATKAGLFYGIQTVRQLLVQYSGKADTTTILPGYFIKDTPRYQWRGSMLDVARNFLHTDYVKQHIERMAFYKLNRLHLHLTDDQGWRITINRYQELTEHGGKGHVDIGEGGQAGFYTLTDFQALVEHAKKYHVQLVPEIDMPGHTYAALSSLLTINCPGFTNIRQPEGPVIEPPPMPPALYSGIGVKFSSLCLPHMDKSLQFAMTVWNSVISQSPFPFIHMGADELPFYQNQYKKFVPFLDRFARSKLRQPVFWEEAAETNLSSGTRVQEWLSKSSVLSRAAEKDYRVIRSVCPHLYLDHGNVPNEPNAADWCAPAVTLEDVYNFDPGDSLQIEGIEATLFGEHIVNRKIADRRMFPRLLAVAEMGWTPQNQKNLAGFLLRVASHEQWLKGIHYFCTPSVPWTTSCPK